MLDPRQIVLLVTALVVPGALIVMRRDRLLLAWICLTVCVDIFNAQLLVNLPAARLTGLLLLPQTVALLLPITRTRPGTALVLEYLYLVLLGLAFGFLVPWPSGGLSRAFNQVASGRAVIYLIRSAGDLGVAFFVARYVASRRRVGDVIRFVLVGTSVACYAALLELLTRLDLYDLITGLRPMSLPLRMRGFNYEPRGLGLLAAHGLLLAVLWYSRRPSFKAAGLVLLHAVALALAASTSAAVAVAVGGVALFIVSRPTRLVLIGLGATAGLAVALLLETRSGYLDSYIENARVRLTVGRIDRRPETPIENLAFRMDIFDGPAVLFLASNPAFLVFGTGPGLVSLPATAYVPPSPDFAWASEEGINVAPTTGIVLELANAGLIGLTLWLTVVVSALRAFRRVVEDQDEQEPAWSIGRGAFAAAAAMYLAQASAVSAIWPVFVGTGLTQFLAYPHPSMRREA